MAPTIKEMIREYLEKNGYDGLSCPWAECGCEINDLMPCDGPEKDECFAGHRVEDPTGEVDYLIFPGKAEET